MTLFWLDYVSMFLLVFTRVSAFFVAAPIFSVRSVPVQYKIGLSVSLTIVAFSVIPIGPAIPIDAMFFLLILKETMIGLSLGFIAYLFFTAVQVSGSFIDMQMGFGIANVIDPQTGAQSPLMGNFKFIFAVLLFLSFNGHHLMIEAVIQSYKWLPLNQTWPTAFGSESLTEFMISSFTAMFMFAFQMAAPIVGALFLTDVAMGIISKAVPQVNIFIVGLPLKILVAFMLMVILIPGYLYLFQKLFADIFRSMNTLLQILGG
jgi:flagellar biosynthetic protein FliR